MLRRIFGMERDETVAGWRELHNELNLYSLPDIIRMIKSRRMRWVGHVACIGRNVYGVLGGGGEARRKESARKTKM
jgi:hypothetical protein